MSCPWCLRHICTGRGTSVQRESISLAEVSTTSYTHTHTHTHTLTHSLTHSLSLSHTHTTHTLTHRHFKNPHSYPLSHTDNQAKPKVKPSDPKKLVSENTIESVHQSYCLSVHFFNKPISSKRKGIPCTLYMCVISVLQCVCVCE